MCSGPQVSGDSHASYFYWVKQIGEGWSWKCMQYASWQVLWYYDSKVCFLWHLRSRFASDFYTDSLPFFINDVLYLIMNFLMPLSSEIFMFMIYKYMSTYNWNIDSTCRGLSTLGCPAVFWFILSKACMWSSNIILQCTHVSKAFGPSRKATH